ncbi:glycosyl transferase [Nonlabens arenilitoris]|uniref:Glycosyl transferase n=1 Tax=Nonlabens arenilitoris TaxID=1217969 RepID=A0A2S7UB78_9FLAO|nr:glycosyltransferase family 10 [Nonlabens arenilitoris]PQJ32188.1 glycosyl transferase [Nonlabens arenilitoris]
MKEIKVFTSGNMRWTPFGVFDPQDIPFLNAHGISMVEKVQQADVIVSQNLKYLRKYIYRYAFTKKFLLWSNEPRFDTTSSDVKKYALGIAKVHIMNVYNAKVFHSTTPFNHSFFRESLHEIPEDFQFKNKKVVALMSFYKGLNTEAVIIGKKDVDLIKKRTEIALYGHSNNALDVYGKGWPDNISLEDSREGDWSTRKKDLLRPYHFNLSFENTTARNYITEKIWDSIENYCLPIYFGDNGIYELFPENSFIDYSKMSSPKELFDFIDNLENVEFVTRLNRCISVYQKFHLHEATFFIKERNKSLMEIVKTLNQII